MLYVVYMLYICIYVLNKYIHIYKYKQSYIHTHTYIYIYIRIYILYIYKSKIFIYSKVIRQCLPNLQRLKGLEEANV